ncbi:DUF2877 domain-containing protein [Nocardioides sp. JQ2195]|nr:DUF2877 domain-containing protein [Nocardioides sp. JQ2195]
MLAPAADRVAVQVADQVADQVAVQERLGGAATVRVRDALAGPRRSARVVHSGRDALYVELPAVAGRGPGLVGVLSRHATHVPCGIRTLLDRVDEVDQGALLSISDGVLRLPRHDLAVARIVDASVPRSSAIGAALVEQLRDRLEGARRLVGAELPDRALDALRTGDPSAVRSLLGRGSGLTPLGDDVLAGWLAVGRTARVAGWTAVAEQVRRLAQRRTTLLSGTLLADATRGEVIPELRRLLLDGPPALEPLLRVGHTSGCGLAVGAFLALAEPEGSLR